MFWSEIGSGFGESGDTQKILAGPKSSTPPKGKWSAPNDETKKICLIIGYLIGTVAHKGLYGGS